MKPGVDMIHPKLLTLLDISHNQLKYSRKRGVSAKYKGFLVTHFSRKPHDKNSVINFRPKTVLNCYSKVDQ